MLAKEHKFTNFLRKTTRLCLQLKLYGGTFAPSSLNSTFIYFWDLSIPKETSENISSDSVSIHRVQKLEDRPRSVFCLAELEEWGGVGIICTVMEVAKNMPYQLLWQGLIHYCFIAFVISPTSLLNSGMVSQGQYSSVPVPTVSSPLPLKRHSGSE
jgi:hypothetical protein